MKNDYNKTKELKTHNFGETVMDLKKMTIESHENSKECKFVEAILRFVSDTNGTAEYNLKAHDYSSGKWFSDKDEKIQVTIKKRISLRKQIQKSGNELYSSIRNANLQYLAGELMSLNEDHVILNPDTVGADEILRSGFTTNQIKWVKRLNELLKEQGSE